MSRSRFRHGWIFAAVWLFYLGENFSTLWDRPDDWQRMLGLVSLVLFVAGYMVVLIAIRPAREFPARRGAVLRVWLLLLGLLALMVAQFPGAGYHALTCVTYVAAAAVMGLPLAHGIPLAGVLVVCVELLSRMVPGWTDNGYGLAALLGALASWGIRLAMERQDRLAAANAELATLAVQQERTRIAADLHDILGHSLTVVTVKAELAQRLLDVDLDKARAELRDLEALARDALADVRATAMGVRGISLPGEIAAAREALAAANVEADLPGAADEVPSTVRELFAWTIREAVTNIVRHSYARHATVRLGPDSVEIVDDGVGGAETYGGTGLAGLRHRVEEAGGRLIAGSRDDCPGFRVRVEVPAQKSPQTSPLTVGAS